MKLTWFGGTTMRLHIGGEILVMDAEQRPDGIDSAELVSGADQVFASSGAGLAEVDGLAWRPRGAVRLIDEESAPAAVIVSSIGRGVLLIDALGEPPLVLVAEQLPDLGRWIDKAVVVLMGDGRALSLAGNELLDRSSPRLLVLAARADAIDDVVDQLRPKLDGTGLMALEPGMALEI